MPVEPTDSENPLWSAASRTLRADAGAHDLKQLALRQNREPLRQYLALRLGSEQAAREALVTLAERVSSWDVARLTEGPGPRAQLFKLARDYVIERGCETSPSAVDGKALEHGTDAASGIRKLGPEHSELLELRHARELSPVEIAHVIQVGVPEVKRTLAAAEVAGAAALGAAQDALSIATARTFAASPDPQVHAVEEGADSLKVGTVIGDRYTIEKAVGIGAFGQVYRATDNLVEGHRVALKILHQPAKSEQERQTALRELRLIASVFHPSIVSFKDHGWFAGRFWFVMPWYDGEPLESRMAREPLTREEAVRIFTPLANALASMHAVGVRHQDIKPENIFLAQLKTDPLGEDQLQPVLLDLGVAATDADSLVAGTPAYFAPEVAATCSGEPFAPISDKSDVFSLALSLRNALEPDTAQEVEGTAIQLFIAQRAQQLPEPPHARELAFLAPYFERWMARDPDARPTAAEFAAELNVLLEPERKAKKRAAFLSWFVPVMAAFLVVLAGGAFVWSQQMRAQENRAHAAELQAQEAELAAKREASLRASLQEEHGELQQQHEQTTRAHAELSTALEETEAQADKLSARAAALARARRSTAKELEETEAALGDVSAKAEELSLTKAQLEGRVNDLTGRVKQLIEQVRSLDQMLADTRELLEAEEGRARSLQQRLEATAAKRDQLEQELAKVREERDTLRKGLKKTGAQLAASEAQTQELEKTVKSLQQKNRKLEKENRELQRPPPGTKK